MDNKVWVEKHIYTDCDQVVVIQPNETMDSLVLVVKEIDGAEVSRLYLNKKEVNKFCKELKSSLEEYNDN